MSAPLHAVFYANPVEGKTFIRIHIDDKSVHDVEATEQHQLDYSAAWAAYNGSEDYADQHRIETQAWVDPATVEPLKAAHVYTVELLAEVSDSRLEAIKLPGMTRLRERAREFVAEKERAAGFDEVKKENEDLRRRLEALESHVDSPEDNPRWPRLNDDGEWVDSAGAVYDAAAHAPVSGAYPGVTKAGVFRRRAKSA